MAKIDYAVADLQVREVATDPANWICEGSIDARGDLVVMDYVRMRGRQHGDDGSIMFLKSTDRGRTWSKPVVAMPEHETWGFTSAGIKILSDGTILALAHNNTLLAERVQNTSFIAQIHIARSTDGGATWSQPEPIHVWPMRYTNNWDNPVELADGTLLMACSGTVSEINITTSIHESPRSVMLRSDDRGKNWYVYGTIAFDPSGLHHFHEPGLTIAPDGRMIALLRQHYPVCKSRPPGGQMFWAESDDGGATWTRFRRSGIWGYPTDPVTLPDGGILAIFGHRGDPLSIKVALSHDGREWSEDNARVIYEPPSLGQQPGTHLDSGFRHIGYPSATVLDDGTVLAVFHAFNRSKDQNLLLGSFRIERKAGGQRSVTRQAASLVT
jgi:hypothetical protein